MTLNGEVVAASTLLKWLVGGLAAVVMVLAGLVYKDVIERIGDLQSSIGKIDGRLDVENAKADNLKSQMGDLTYRVQKLVDSINASNNNADNGPARKR